jgi:hypothetical protein
MQEFIFFEPSLILSKDARSPEPYADLALATRALIAALAIEISVFGLSVWLIQLWSARQIVVAYSESRRPLHESVIGFCRAKAPTKGPDLRFANSILYGVPLRLDIDPVEPQGILVNDAVDAAITGLPDNLPKIP